MSLASGLPPGTNQLENYSPRITDFGLGTFLDCEADTQSGFWQGTPPYMSPEQVLPDFGPATELSDIYSLGAILYELLTGRPIYNQRSVANLAIRLSSGQPLVRPRKLRREIPLDLESICLKCLEVEPSRRYQSAEALREDLLRFLCGQPTQARPLPFWERASRHAKRAPVLTGVLSCLLVAVLTLMGLWCLHVSDRRESGLILQVSNKRLNQLLDVLRIRELRARERAYGSDLRLADVELDASDIELAQQYLERQIPSAEESDLREFAWSLQWNRVSSSYQRYRIQDPLWLQAVMETGAVDAQAFDRFNRLFELKGFSGQLGLDRKMSLANNTKWAWIASRDQADLGARITEEDDLVLFKQGRLIETGLKAAAVAFDADGKTMVVSDPTWHANVESVAQVQPRFGEFLLEPGGLPIRVLTIPRATELSIASRGNVVAAMLEEPASKTCVPWFHDLEQGWTVSYPSLRRKLYLGESVYVTLALSEDGQVAALAGEQPWLKVFEPRQGTTRWEVAEHRSDHVGRISALAFSHDDRRVALGYSTGSLRIRLIEDGRVLSRSSPSNAKISGLAFSRDNQTLAVFSESDEYVRIWHPEINPRSAPRLVHGDEVWALQFSRDSKTLFSAGDDHLIVAWDVDGRRSTHTMAGHESLVSAMALSSDGKTLASGDYEGQVNFWNPGTGELTKAYESVLPGRVRTLAWSPDTRYLVVGGNCPSLALWDRASKRWSGLALPTEDCFGAAFSPDGNHLVIGSHDSQLAVLDLPGFEVAASRATGEPLSALAISPDGSQIATGHRYGAIRLWSFPSLILQAVEKQGSENGSIWALAYSPDGRTLASSGEDTMVRLWNPKDLDLLCRLEEHDRTVRGLAFSHDGQMLSSGDLQGQVRLWVTASEPASSEEKGLARHNHQ